MKERRPVYAIQIGPAVLIKVNHTQAPQNGFHLILPALRIIAQNKIDPARRSRIFEHDRSALIRSAEHSWNCQRRTRAAEQPGKFAARPMLAMACHLCPDRDRTYVERLRTVARLSRTPDRPR